MAIKAEKIWMNGEFVNWTDAKIHVLSHVVHYGSGVFEGIRAYETSDGGGAVFRLQEHCQRLVDSATIYRMLPEQTADDFCNIVLETLRLNKLPSAYIRPLIYRGFGEPGLNPQKSPLEAMVAAWKWGSYLGEAGLENGISACISSWTRSAPNTLPALSKACGNYLSSQLIKMEAIENGYDEGIALDVDGWLSEGSGENLFVVSKGVLYTVPFGSSILPGITRATILELAKNANIPIVETRLAREFLYLADEIFLTGTAAEVTPVTKVDRISVGTGMRGPITEKLQTHYFDIVKGKDAQYSHWLTKI